MAVVPNTIRLAVTAQQESSARVTVLHYKTAAAHVWTSAELLQFATNFWTTVGAFWKPACNVGVTFNSIKVDDLGNFPAATATYLIPAGQIGLIAGEAIPANAAAVISWHGPYSGRSFQGRSYMYGLAEASTSGSLLTSAMVTLLQALGLAISSFINGTGQVAFLSIYSRKLGLSTPVLTYTVDNLVDSQRRRLIGRGN